MLKDFLSRRRKSDGGSAELISLIIIIPLVLGILFTMIDTSIYFSNRSTIQAVARDGARTVAIMGGNGTRNTQTAIEKEYGLPISVCSDPVLAEESVVDALDGTQTAIECNMLKTLANTVGLTNIKVNSVECTPTSANAIGTRTSCSVSWNYGSIPGSGLTFIKKRNSDGSRNEDSGLVATNITVGTSESEVNLSEVPLVPRSPGFVFGSSPGT